MFDTRVYMISKPVCGHNNAEYAVFIKAIRATKWRAILEPKDVNAANAKLNQMIWFTSKGRNSHQYYSG